MWWWTRTTLISSPHQKTKTKIDGSLKHKHATPTPPPHTHTRTEVRRVAVSVGKQVSFQRSFEWVKWGSIHSITLPIPTPTPLLSCILFWIPVACSGSQKLCITGKSHPQFFRGNTFLLFFFFFCLLTFIDYYNCNGVLLLYNLWEAKSFENWTDCQCWPHIYFV